MNLKIRELQNSIINFINKYDLPIEVKRLVIRDIARTIEEQAETTLLEEINARDAKEAAGKEEKKDAESV